MLQSRASLLHHQRHKARQLPCLDDGCRAVKVGVQPGLSRSVLPSRVPAPPGTVCWRRDSAACQGKGKGKLWVEGESPSMAGQGMVLLLSRECCMGQGFSQLQLSLGTFLRGLLKKPIRLVAPGKGRAFLNLCLVVWGWHWRSNFLFLLRRRLCDS